MADEPMADEPKKKVTPDLEIAWADRVTVIEQSDILWDATETLYREGKTLRIEGEKLHNAAENLRREARALQGSDISPDPRRVAVQAKIRRMFIEADDIAADGDTLFAQGEQKVVEAHTSRAAIEKSLAVAEKAWTDAVIKAHGDIKIETKWRDGVVDHYLDNGEVYKGDDKTIEVIDNEPVAELPK